MKKLVIFTIGALIASTFIFGTERASAQNSAVEPIRPEINKKARVLRPIKMVEPLQIRNIKRANISGVPTTTRRLKRRRIRRENSAKNNNIINGEVMDGIGRTLRNKNNSRNPLRNSTSSDFRIKVKERLQNRANNVRQKIENKSTARHERLREAAKKRVGAFIGRLVRRFIAAVSRLQKINRRIESRIKKIEERGIDLPVAKIKLDEAKTAIARAQETVDALRDRLLGLLEENEPRAAMRGIKTAILDAKDSIKNAHKKLVETIVAIKAGLAKKDKNNEE